MSCQLFGTLNNLSSKYSTCEKKEEAEEKEKERKKFPPICASIPPWMEEDVFDSYNANSAIPWQVLISGTVYILEL